METKASMLLFTANFLEFSLYKQIYWLKDSNQLEQCPIKYFAVVLNFRLVQQDMFNCF